MCHVNGNISAADYDDSALQFVGLVSKGSTKEVDRSGDTFCIFSRNASFAAALGTDGEIEGLISLFSEVVQRDVFAHVDTAFDFDTEFFDDVDFCVNDIFLKLKGRDAVGHHAARLLILLKYGGMVSCKGKIIGAG